MAQDADAVEEGLSRDELLALRNKRTGVAVFQLSWMLVFVSLIIVNLTLRANYASWPPSGVTALDSLLPTAATIGLIVSGLLARRALNAVRVAHMESFYTYWAAALGLGVLFLLVMAYEFLTVQISGQYSSMFRVMTAFHAIHALVIGLIMWNVYTLARAGTYDAVHHWGIEAATKMWYFVVVAWIMFYTVLYLI